MLTIFKARPTVEEIHEEIDSAQERLLNNALAILEKHSSTEERAARLNKLGFVLAPEVKQVDLIKMNRSTAELVEYYRDQYPGLKFLTLEEMTRICNKYDLFMAPVARYTKSVPDKNIAEIESVQPLQERDAMSYRFMLREDPSNRRGNKLRGPKEIVAQLKAGMDVTDILASSDFGRYYIDTREWSRGVDMVGYYALPILKKMHPGLAYDYSSIGFNSMMIDQRGLFIAAPKSHFNTEGLAKEGRSFFNSTGWTAPDPIVYRHCRGGIQVLSKWGEEANDEALQ